jgi:serine/threonine protein kinase
MSVLRNDRSRDDLPNDAVIGQYRIVSEIGAGGMGKVYRAIDTKLDRHVAIKVLRPELLRNRDKVRRFRQEAKAASSLNHPSIVTVLDVGEMKDSNGEAVDFIVMELVDGESLGQKLRQRLPLNRRLELVARIADGMVVAHAAGVIHRDLKPDNILVTNEGQPKIVDFGLAKLTQPELLATGESTDTLLLTASRDGMVLGTVGYMSPEQVEGRDVDHRSDIFSLGCILYEVVAGQRAFDSDSAVATLHKILKEDPPPLRRRNPSLPHALEHIVQRCLAKDRE